MTPISSILSQCVVRAIAPSLALVLLAAFLTVGLASAPAQAKEDVPTKITADKLRYSPSGKQVIFEGAVTVKREKFTLNADTITVYLSGEPGKKSGGAVGRMDPGSLEKIVARGKVRLTQEGRVGTCRTATYLVGQGLFKMEGDPVLTDGKNRLTGEVIKFYTKDNQSEVLGGDNKRVEALFFTPKGVDLP